MTRQDMLFSCLTYLFVQSLWSMEEDGCISHEKQSSPPLTISADYFSKTLGTSSYSWQWKPKAEEEPRADSRVAPRWQLISSPSRTARIWNFTSSLRSTRDERDAVEVSENSMCKYPNNTQWKWCRTGDTKSGQPRLGRQVKPKELSVQHQLWDSGLPAVLSYLFQREHPFSGWFCLDAQFLMSFRNNIYLALKVLFWGHFLFPFFLLWKRKKGRKKQQLWLVWGWHECLIFMQCCKCLSATQWQVLWQCHVSIQKQPACQAEAWASAHGLFSVLIRHVRFSHSIWEIILVFLSPLLFLIIFFSCLFAEQ